MPIGQNILEVAYKSSDPNERTCDPHERAVTW